MKRKIFPDTCVIDPTQGDRDMDVWVPVKSPAVGVDGAENTHLHAPASARIEQVVDGQATQGIEPVTVMKEQRPQGVRQCEHQVLPGTLG
ncbi:hypothetical protein ALP81_200072 [Pseudomonas savastanoi pv. fraxini]|nr:hypothetical protein ALP81_200072 [Pseudomonas savastanoi pv. fraxini]